MMIHALLYSALLCLALLGITILSGIRQGWLRRGYFTTPAVILIVLGIFLVFQTAGGVFGLLLTQSHLASRSTVILTLNGIAELGVLLGGCLLLSRSFHQNPFAVFRLEGFHETPPTAYLLSLPIILSAQVVGVALSSLWTSLWQLFPNLFNVINRYESLSDKEMESIVTAHDPIHFVLILVMVAVVPAFAEETMFRGFAQSNLERSGRDSARPFWALAIASLLFAAIHMSLLKFPGLLALGLALGWMAYRTNNLFVGSLGHAVNNGVIIILLYLSPELGTGVSNSKLVGNGDMTPWEAGSSLLLSLPVLIVFIGLFNKVTAGMSSRNNAQREYNAQMKEQNLLYPDELQEPDRTHTFDHNHDK